MYTIKKIVIETVIKINYIKIHTLTTYLNNEKEEKKEKC